VVPEVAVERIAVLREILRVALVELDRALEEGVARRSAGDAVRGIALLPEDRAGRAAAMSAGQS